MRAVQTGEFDGGSVFIDGDWKPLAEAKISLFDWGFTRSDATYDVASVWKGAFFRLDDHLDRFFASLAKMRMAIPYPRAEVRADRARLRSRRRPQRFLRRDGLHARRPAARRARSAPRDQSLLRVRAAVRLDRAARKAEAGDRPAREPARSHRARVGRPDGEELPLDRSRPVALRSLRPGRGHELRRRRATATSPKGRASTSSRCTTASSARRRAAFSRACRGAR